MKTCETCKFWDDKRWEYRNTCVRLCTATPMFWDATEWNSDGDRVLIEKYKNTRAFVQDGSDYNAVLLTKADFGCTQHEPKD